MPGRAVLLQFVSLKSAAAAVVVALIALGPWPAPAKVPAAHLSAALPGGSAIGSVLDRAGTYDDGSDGSRRCGWLRRYDAYGNYIGKVRSCS